jgi:hypothetical protein
MPRTKKLQEFFTHHLIVIDEVIRHMEEHQYDFSTPSNPALPVQPRQPGSRVPIRREELLTLIRLAQRPERAMCGTIRNEEFRMLATLYAKWPDEVLSLLTLIRRLFAECRKGKDGWIANKARLVRGFLRTHSHALNAKGISTPVLDLSDGEISAYLSKLVGRNISTHNVKKARQSVNKQDARWFIAEHPTCQQFIEGKGYMIGLGPDVGLDDKIPDDVGQPVPELKELLDKRRAREVRRPARGHSAASPRGASSQAALDCGLPASDPSR